MKATTVTITPVQRRAIGRAEAWARAARQLAEAYQQACAGGAEEATFVVTLEVEKPARRLTPRKR